METMFQNLGDAAQAALRKMLTAHSCNHLCYRRRKRPNATQQETGERTH